MSRVEIAAQALPVLTPVDDDREPNADEVRVESPTGATSIVPKSRADSLKSQGYRIG